MRILKAGPCEDCGAAMVAEIVEDYDRERRFLGEHPVNMYCSANRGHERSYEYNPLVGFYELDPTTKRYEPTQS